MQFYRQKPIGNYIVDFYAPAARLVVEVDGSHHSALAQARYDKRRSEYLEQLSLKVLRFDDPASFDANGVCCRGDLSVREREENPS